MVPAKRPIAPYVDLTGKATPNGLFGTVERVAMRVVLMAKNCPKVMRTADGLWRYRGNDPLLSAHASPNPLYEHLFVVP